MAHQSDPVWALAFLRTECSRAGAATGGSSDVRDPTDVKPSGRPLVHSKLGLGFGLDTEKRVLAVADGDSAVVLYDARAGIRSASGRLV